MGDIVHTFPAVHLLRKSFPDCTLSWLVNDCYAELVERSPDVDDVIPFYRDRWCSPRHWGEVVDFIRKLRLESFDVVIDFQGLLRSGLIAFFSGSPRKIGFQDSKECAGLFYNEKILLPSNISHAIDKNVFLVRSAFQVTESFEMPPVKSCHHDNKTAQALFRVHEFNMDNPVIALAPATRWASKTWSVNFYVSVLERLYQQRPEANIWLLGGEADREMGDQIVKGCNNAGPKNFIGELNFGILIELLRASNVILGCDSGPMHLASLLGVPVVALFGPTSPELTGPYPRNEHTVITGNCEKRPCFEKECPLKEAVCKKSVSSDEVANALLSDIEQ